MQHSDTQQLQPRTMGDANKSCATATANTGSTATAGCSRPNKQNRLQNSMRLLMKQASEFHHQQQLQQKNNNNLNNNGTKTNIVEDTGTSSCNMNMTVENDTSTGSCTIAGIDHRGNNNTLAGIDHQPLKQVGVVLQQQIRGLRRRVKSVRSLQQQSNHHGGFDGSNNSEDGNDDELPQVSRAPVAIISPTSIEDDDDDDNMLNVSKLTPKKKSQYSPIPQKTVKIDLQHCQSSSSSSINHPESLPEAVGVWLDSCHHLLTGPDMIRFVQSTGYVYYHCASICVQTITLPITLPVHITCLTVRSITSVMGGVLNDSVPLIQQSSGQVSVEDHRHRGILGGLLSLPGTLLDITGKVAIAIVAPVLGGGHDENLKHQQQSTGASSSPEEKEKAVIYAKTPMRYPASTTGSPDYLDRLRLDYCGNNNAAEECHKTMPCRKLFSTDEESKPSYSKPVAVVEQSNYILRVNDWGVTRPTDDCDLYYIDISPSALNKNNQELVDITMDRFVQGAITLLNNHPICQISMDCGSMLQPSHLIQWNPEGSTKRILRETNQAVSSPSNKMNPFKDEILIWSGRFQQQHEAPNGYGRKHGFFLARGCIPMSPDSFVKLLWDNTRTAEYNNFCLGRFTLHCLSSSSESNSDDDKSFLDGSSKTASKVIQSEMRVPFAGITVKATCLMHVRPLSTNDGYIICSRSLDVGPSGVHTTTSILNNNKRGGSQIITPSKNEILWGVNIIRSIPEHPNGTELTSLSQVGSAVPSFLAQKIGLMGIGDFFKNVRQVAENNNFKK